MKIFHQPAVDRSVISTCEDWKVDRRRSAERCACAPLFAASYASRLVIRRRNSRHDRSCREVAACMRSRQQHAEDPMLNVKPRCVAGNLCSHSVGGRFHPSGRRLGPHPCDSQSIYTSGTRKAIVVLCQSRLERDDVPVDQPWGSNVSCGG